jgi:hypothetical protein
MGKKLLWVVVITFLFLFAGWLVYRRMVRVRPQSPPVASQWPSSLPPNAAAPNNAPSVSPPPAPVGSGNKKESSPAEPSFVLKQGETLDYDANIAKLNSTVAKLRISAVEKRNSDSKDAWHLRAVAHTESPYRMVFELDDQFDSYSEAGNMTSVQYEMHLNERGQKVDSVEQMLHSMQDSIPSAGSGVRVPPGTRDPIGMLEYLRGVDWAQNREVRSPVFDGRKLYDVRTVYMGKANAVKVAAGTFNTIKIELHVFDNGEEMKDAHFLLYLTNDAARLPVLLEAVLPIATARVELTKAKE